MRFATLEAYSSCYRPSTAHLPVPKEVYLLMKEVFREKNTETILWILADIVCLYSAAAISVETIYRTWIGLLFLKSFYLFENGIIYVNKLII